MEKKEKKKKKKNINWPNQLRDQKEFNEENLKSR